MRKLQIVSLLLSLFLHCAPILSKVTPAIHGLTSSPMVLVMKWVASLAALGGVYHTVSAATGLVSPSSVAGKTGTRLSYQIKLTGRDVGRPKSWSINGQVLNSPGTSVTGMPQGLSFNLGTGIISGTPTKAGSFEVTIFAYEHANARGPSLSFTLTFDIQGSNSPLSLTLDRTQALLHPGESIALQITTTGGDGSAITFQWEKDGIPIPDITGSLFTLNSITVDSGGTYQVSARQQSSTASSSQSISLTVVPLHLKHPTLESGIPGPTGSLPVAHLEFSSISGRKYRLQSADDLSSHTWTEVATLTAFSDTTIFQDRRSASTTGIRIWRIHLEP